MGLSDRWFAPPVFDAKKAEERQAKLPRLVAELLRQARNELADGYVDAAQRAITSILRIVPNQPDALCLQGIISVQLGHTAEAATEFEQALGAAPDDALIFYHYARLLERTGNVGGAYKLRKQAVDRIIDSPLAWSDLGEHLFTHVSIEASLEPLEKSIRLAPEYAPACLKLGTALVNCGRIDEGVASIRRALQLEPAFGAAWASLADIKTVSFLPDEVALMRELLNGNALNPSERTAVKFALARACEEQQSYKEAYELLMDANAGKRSELEWSSTNFSWKMAHIAEVFRASNTAASDPDLGDKVIFIVGLPRSGTTLIEQILASHSQVEGAGELGNLGVILAEESKRRRQYYPEWVPQATSDDWLRLGRRYMESTSVWRRHRDYSTDKALTHWMGLGAIRAMLPGARIVICRRDPVETCWSCFKQLFSTGFEFSYNLNEMAEYWKNFDREATWWAGHAPDHVTEQRYESLLTQPREEIRKLLQFCGLEFEESCVHFHKTKRTVKTLSAAQVRQPLRPDTARAVHYGALLDPLRIALEMHPLVDSRESCGMVSSSCSRGS